MARTDAFYKNHGIFINAAIIGAYANTMADNSGFSGAVKTLKCTIGWLQQGDKNPNANTRA